MLRLDNKHESQRLKRMIKEETESNKGKFELGRQETDNILSDGTDNIVMNEIKEESIDTPSPMRVKEERQCVLKAEPSVVKKEEPATLRWAEQYDYMNQVSENEGTFDSAKSNMSQNNSAEQNKPPPRGFGSKLIGQQTPASSGEFTQHKTWLALSDQQIQPPSNNKSSCSNQSSHGATRPHFPGNNCNSYIENVGMKLNGRVKHSGQWWSGVSELKAEGGHTWSGVSELKPVGGHRWSGVSELKAEDGPRWSGVSELKAEDGHRWSGVSELKPREAGQRWSGVSKLKPQRWSGMSELKPRKGAGAKQWRAGAKRAKQWRADAQRWHADALANERTKPLLKNNQQDVASSGPRAFGKKPPPPPGQLAISWFGNSK